MKNAFLIFTCFLLLTACQNDDEKLVGHWHLRTYEAGHDYLTLDFTPEQKVFLNKGLFGSSGIYGRWDKGEKTMAFGTECFFEKYEFDTKSDTLYFFQKDGKEFHAYKCEYECCDKQADFFGSSLVDIDLPIIKDTTELIKAGKDEEYFRNEILIGLPRLTYHHVCFPIGPRLQLGDSFKTIDDISIWFKIKKEIYPKGLRDNLEFVIYANEKNDLKSIQEIIEKLQELNEQKIYLALREKDYEEELKIWLRKIESHENLEKIIQKYYSAGKFGEIN